MVPLRPPTPPSRIQPGRLTIVRLVTAGLLGALLLAGCGTRDPYFAVIIGEDGIARPCVDDTAPVTATFLPCPLAVDLAVSQISLAPGNALAVEFHRGELCPEDQSCRRMTDRGAVMVWFGGVPPVFVRVTPDFVGGFVAQPPELPPQWLVDRGPWAPLAP